MQKNIQQSKTPVDTYEESQNLSKQNNKSISDASWSSLWSRYKNVWRAKLRNKEDISGIKTNLSIIALFGITSIFTAQSGAMILMMFPIGLTIGLVFGSLFSGYKFGTDDFINGHIGGSLGLFLTLYVLFLSLFAGLNIFFYISLLFVGIWYVLSLSVASIGYGIFGRILNDDIKDGNV